MAQSQRDTNPHIIEAQNHIGAGRFGEAVRICRDLLKIDADSLDAMNVMGIAYACSGEPMKSAEALSQAVISAPQTTKYKTNFAKAIGMLRTQDASTNKADQIKAAIQVCLEDDQIDHKVFSHVWYALLMKNQTLASLTLSFHEKSFDALAAPLSDSFLHFGLRRLIAAGGVQYERLMASLRRYFLLSTGYDAQVFLPFLCALAEQCHLNEYVYACSDEERAALDLIEGELNGLSSFDFADASAMTKIALVGCYRDIDQSAYAALVHDAVDDLENGDFESFVEVLIVGPMKVQALRSSIPVLSLIEDSVSTSVREQYEDNPYPRWRCITAPDLTEEQRAHGRGKTILVAGCGTGQEILNMALHYPEAALITGVDLSKASLAYGKQKAIELGVENVEFMQADILEIGKLDRQFDMIVCSGVLHHMRDPMAGWTALLSCLKPDGVMKVALYSEIARKYVTQCQGWIKEQGFDATPEGISSFRQAVMAMRDRNPLKAMVEPIDFYSMSMCRDLLFHVQEHVYTLPQIKDVLDDLDLRLLALNIKQPGVLRRYRAAYPNDPSAIDLDNWHEFEQENPAIFVGMYPFWCGKNGDEMPAWVFTDRS